MGLTDADCVAHSTALVIELCQFGFEICAESVSASDTSATRQVGGERNVLVWKGAEGLEFGLKEACGGFACRYQQSNNIKRAHSSLLYLINFMNLCSQNQIM